MRNWLLGIVLLVIAAGMACLVFWHNVPGTFTRHPYVSTPPREAPRQSDLSATTSPRAFPAASISTNPSKEQPPAKPAMVAAPSGAQPPPVPPTFESTNLPPATILENMRTVVRQYGSTFGGNPVGTNPEIAKALQGQNPKQINFLKTDGNRLNANGELVDPWGTPYFFHQLSGTEMEIRSAGPDRVMYTGDDLVAR